MPRDGRYCRLEPVSHWPFAASPQFCLRRAYISTITIKFALPPYLAADLNPQRRRSCWPRQCSTKHIATHMPPTAWCTHTAASTKETLRQSDDPLLSERDSRTLCICMREPNENPDRKTPGPDNKQRSSLGDFFSDLPFSADEMGRLAALIVTRSTPGHIISHYALRSDAYKKGFLRTERFPGSRPGKPLYNKQAIQRIIERLGQPAHPNYARYWSLYKEAAVAYIKCELSALDRLLTETNLPDGTLSVADAMRTLCVSASEYSVSTADIETFYQIWGIPRIQNFDTLFPQWMAASEAGAQRRDIRRLQSETARLHTLVEGLLGTAERQIQAIATEFRSARASADECRNLATKVDSLSQRFLELSETTPKADLVSTLDKRISVLTEQVDRLSDKVKTPREQVSQGDLNKLAVATELNIGASAKELTGALSTRMREDLSLLANEFETKLSTLSAELNKRRPTATTVDHVSPPFRGYRSPLIGLPSQSPHSHRISTELEFINTWQHHLSRKHDVALTFEQAVAYHRAFLGSPVLLTDRVLALTWIHCLAWQPYTLHLAASPTWSSEEDWAQGAEHLFRKGNGLSPRFLVIHNYDVGLPDCYLAPSLTLWALQRESAWETKLFLLPARNTHTPCAQILEHAVCFSNNEYITTRPIDLKAGVRSPAPPPRELAFGVEPRLVDGWAKPHTRITHDSAFERAMKCKLTSDLVASFERTASSLSQYIVESSATAVGMHHQVIPWVQATFGEAKAIELGSLIQAMAGGAN